jgi:predicted GNAT family N-acyltransferase
VIETLVVKFDALHAPEIERIRNDVFTREQHIDSDIDFDGQDGEAVHVLAAYDGKNVGTGRMLRDGHIGRLAVLQAFRGRGLGAAVVQTLVKEAVSLGMGRVYLGAQVHALGFYEKLGFSVCGGSCVEAGIEHVHMERLLGLPAIALRPATYGDLDFIFGLQKTTMHDYVDQLWGWDDEEQQAYLRERFDPARERMILLDGNEIGVIATEERETEIFLSKLYILPQYQRQGIGSQLIRRLLDTAWALDLPVTLRVMKTNPARRLYERLGFVETGETDVQYLMRATPPEQDGRL